MATCNPIVALDVLAFDSEPASFSGKVFQYIPIDVNMGAGGKYIYIGYRRGDENVGKPITSIVFDTYSSAQKTNPKAEDGYDIWYPQDLNAGAGGKYVYMFSSTNPEYGAPILGVTVGITNQNSPIYQIGESSSWVTNPVDLNSGAGGKYVWFYTTKSLE